MDDWKAPVALLFGQQKVHLRYGGKTVLCHGREKSSLLLGSLLCLGIFIQANRSVLCYSGVAHAIVHGLNAHVSLPRCETPIQPIHYSAVPESNQTSLSRKI